MANATIIGPKSIPIGRADSNINSVEQLDNLLSEPTDQVIEACRALDGDVVLLGVGGKIGPSLARMIRRGSDLAGIRRNVIGVSRFSAPDSRKDLERAGVKTIACDLLDEAEIERLPDAPNVVYLAGNKFGSMQQKARTWAMNSYLPGLICRKYRHSKIVAFSTGTVYGLAEIETGGSKESDIPAPIGEYAMSCLGRERMFEHFTHKQKTPVVLIRLNYACDLRYGVLVDLATRVFNQQPIELTMGYFNTIWQGDANAMSIQSFALARSPATVINLTGPELLSVREVSETFGRLFGKKVVFQKFEAPTAFLSNPTLALNKFGLPRVPASRLVEWVAAWVRSGGANIGKPTHFESRTGNY